MLHCEVAIARPERTTLRTPDNAGTVVWEFDRALAGGGVHLTAGAANDQRRALTWSVGGGEGDTTRALELCEASLCGAGPSAEAVRLEFASTLFPGAAVIANGGGTDSNVAAVVVVLTADGKLHRITVPPDERVSGRAAVNAVDAGAVRTVSLEAAAQQLGTPTALAAAADGTVVVAGSDGGVLAVPPVAFAEGNLFPTTEYKAAARLALRAKAGAAFKMLLTHRTTMLLCSASESVMPDRSRRWAGGAWWRQRCCPVRAHGRAAAGDEHLRARRDCPRGRPGHVPGVRPAPPRRGAACRRHCTGAS